MEFSKESILLMDDNEHVYVHMHVPLYVSLIVDETLTRIGVRVGEV